MRLFRQRALGQWGEVFTRMADQLRQEVATRGGDPRPGCESRCLRVEVGPGELLDRITILAIKAQKLGAAEKGAVVRAELWRLEQVWDAAVSDRPGLAELRDQLRQVNETLWQVEDELRAAERAGQFDAAFVERARQVYKLNDRRAGLKRRVDEILGWERTEPKVYHQSGPVGTGGSVTLPAD
jgi:hypothetical protein